MRDALSPALAALMDAAASAVDAGDDAGADSLLRRIVAENPRDAEAWHMLAIIAIRAGRAAEASERAKRAHQLDRRNPLYLNTLGVAYGEMQRLEEALRCFRRALRERPDYAEGHYNLGKAVRKLEQYPAAEAAYRRALQLDPSRVDVANNLASLYCSMGRFEDALPLLEKASPTSPDDEAVAANMALALLGSRGPEAAETFLAAHVERNPQSALRGDLALNLLSQGRFADGWRHYASTKRTPTAVPPADLAVRLPEPLRGRDILLIPEQGIGDHLFFLRFSRVLRERGARVALLASAKLYEMLKGNPALDCVIRSGAEVPQEFARAVPVLVGDLPAMLGSVEAVPAFPILVPERRIAAWQERLAQLGPPPYLGVTWRAGRTREPEPEFAPKGPVPLYKDIALEALAAAVKGWRGTVLVLQRLPMSGEVTRFSRALGRPAYDLSASNDALEEMAALLTLVDDYVGVSNTNMHIRAGIGKAARLLVPFPPEFRWMQAGDSPWFPGFKVYRQRPNHDWQVALERLRGDLSR